jgi:hypothetical protein
MKSKCFIPHQKALAKKAGAFLLPGNVFLLLNGDKKEWKT